MTTTLLQNDDPAGLAGSPAASPGLLGRLRETLASLGEATETADATSAHGTGTWAALHRIGLLVAPLSVAHGGAGLLNSSDLVMDVLRALGSADLTLARLIEGHLNAVALVERYGSDSQREDLAAAVRDGSLSAVWGADDAQPLALVREGEALRLRGRKVLASGIGFVRRPLVTAASEGGPTLVLLDLAPGDRADTSRWTAQGMHASATGTALLDGLPVSPAQVIGQPGDFLRQPHFSGGAWRFCAAHLGAAERLIDLFRAQLLARGRGEDPYQLQRLATCVAAVGSAAHWVRDTGRRLSAAVPDESASIVAQANLTRFVTERACLDVLEAVHRGTGLGAFLRPNPVERISRDLSTYLRQPVPDLAMADGARAVLASTRSTAELWNSP